jgi:hypothetical protein
MYRISGTRFQLKKVTLKEERRIMENQLYPYSTGQKRRMVAEAAYYRAQKRGFANSDPVEDWLVAEAEIDEYLENLCNHETQNQEIAAYEKMRRRMTKIFADTRDTINVETFKQAFEKVNKEFKDIGEFLPETVDKASKKLKQETAVAVEKLGSNWKDFSDKGLELFDVWKERGTHFISQASGALSDWVRLYRSKNRDK